MKEEAEMSRKLPPKLMGGSGVNGGGAPSSSTTTNAPSKQQNDEILSALLRMHNFDSISSIKDESLDIDLSACVTITGDPSGSIGSNSLSSSDFWRMLDDSTQTMQLQLDNASNCSSKDISLSPSSTSNILSADDNTKPSAIKKLQTDFTGTFLRPEVPSANGPTFSPLKRGVKPLPSPNDKVVKIDIKQLRDKPPTYSGTSIKLEGIPWLAPIRIHQPTSSPKIPTTTAESVVTKSPNDSRNIILMNIKKEVHNAHDPTTNTPPPLVGLDGLKQDVPPKAKAELIYKCLDCNGKQFQEPDELIHHRSHRIQYKCSECEKEYDLETSLKKHLKTHRPIDARKDAWKKCPDCGKCLKLGSMWMHRKIHADNKKYGCDICGQKFVQKINLTQHIRIHTAEKPYECSECHKRFQERSHLQRHQKYHAQTRSYRCEKCGKMYKTERCLKVHNLVHLEKRPFACDRCDKSFISNSKLKQHSNIHTGERPFKCNYCTRDFTNFPNWLKHTRRRHKVDHKTGEILENIPSYCSKKSSRTAKEKKNNETSASASASADKTSTPTSTTAVLMATSTLVNACTLASGNNSNTMSANIIQNNTDLMKKEKSDIKLIPCLNSVIANANPAPALMKLNTTATAVNMNGPPPLAKMPTKRKKKPIPVISDSKTIQLQPHHVTLVEKLSTITKDPTSPQQTKVNLNLNGGGGPPPLALVFNTSTTAPAVVVGKTAKNIPQLTKTKRERKQSMPKQLQKKPQQSTPPPLLIKKEYVEPPLNEARLSNLSQNNLHAHQQPQQSTKNNFPELHCLSITSAEELLMEEALEWEECMKRNSVDDEMVPSFVDTDNALSSDVMADLHFKIKQEHDMEMKLKSEEAEALKKTICSSLESSPFSSPASLIEFGTGNPLNASNTSTDFITNNFYLPTTFTLSNQMVNSGAGGARNTEHMPRISITTELPQLVATNVLVPELIQITSNAAGSQQQQRSNSQSTMISTPKQTVINQLYVPLAMTANSGAPAAAIIKSNQALPSVDTLLFSHSKMAIYNGVGVANKSPAVVTVPAPNNLS